MSASRDCEYVNEHQPIFREWAPMNGLMEKIPPRFHQGFASKELVLTCVASSCHSVVIGSNAGIVFWFDRGSETMKRRSIDNCFTEVTALSIVLSQYGEALAAGYFHGSIAIFFSYNSQHSPVCIMTQGHANTITSLEWDRSGNHLLSGDDQGKVLLSKFQNNSLQPIKIITNDNTAIVQLKFHPLHHNTSILISSLQRTLVAKIDRQGNINLVQVGRKDRKSLAPFGADFGHFENETLIYSSRRGLRLWLSDCDQGSVRQTLLFKDFPTNSKSKLILLSFREEYLNSEPQFGPVFSLNNGLIVTYSCTSFFLLDTGLNSAHTKGQVSVINYCRFGRKNLRHISVFHNEIFLLLDNRIVIRVSDHPDRSYVARPTAERPLLSSWKDKIPVDLTKAVKPTLQSTISKLTHKFVDIDGGGASIVPSAVHKGAPVVFESISNALAPIFGASKPLLTSERATQAIQIHVSESNDLDVSPSPTVSTTDESSTCKSPILDSTTSSSLTPNSPTWIEDSSLSQLTGNLALTPEPNDQLTMAKPCSTPVSNVDVGSEDRMEEELVYASYVGNKKKVKLTRKKSTQLEALTSWPSGANKPWLQEMNPTKSALTSSSQNFHEELEKKDKLLAQILQLDQIITVDSEPTSEAAEDQIEDSNTSETCDIRDANDTSYSASPSSSDPENDSNIPIEEDTKELYEDIYTQYATENDLLAKEKQPAEEVPKPVIPQAENLKSSTLKCLESNHSSSSSKWARCPLPATQRITNISACRYYVVVIDANKTVYYQSTDPDPAYGSIWHQVDLSAHQICVSYCGKHLWRLYKNAVFQGLGVSLACPLARSWDAIASHVASIGIVKLDCAVGTYFYIWMLRQDGENISIHPVEWPKSTTFIQTPDNVTSMSCNDSHVVVVSDHGKVYLRLNIDHGTPCGVGWQVVTTPDLVTCAVISPGNQIWVWSQLNDFYYMNNRMWYQLPVSEHLRTKHEAWYNVASLFKRQVAEFWLIPTPKGIGLALSNSTHLLVSDHLIGYFWIQVAAVNTARGGASLESWRLLNCNAVYKDIGIYWLVDHDNGLYCFYDNRIEKISLPSESQIVELAVAPQHLWLLTDAGEIFVRSGQSNPIGTGWVELSTVQFASKSQLCHTALGQESAWACDVHGRVYFRFGDNGPPTLLTPAWSLVDDGNITFRQIYAGTSHFMVWAIDTEHNVYVREGIRPDFLIGNAWVRVAGVKAVQLAISEHSVSALSPAGTIHRRCGISQGKVAGDAWEAIPGIFKWISVTIDDVLWALNKNGAIFRLNSASPVISSASFTCRSDVVNVDESEDWVLI